MKIWNVLIIAFFISLNTYAFGGVIVGGTRIIYEGSKKEASISISNPDKSSYLIQSWIELAENNKNTFIVTPPLFRLDAEQQNILRVVRAGGNLPEDRESLFWMNIKSIPSNKKENNANQLQIAVNTRIKLIYRPNGISKENSVTQADKVSFSIAPGILKITNPTPYYMNISKVLVGGRAVENITYIPPMASKEFPIPKGVNGAVTWSLINDFGGVGELHKAM
ncbi:molecular chaperone [Serratia odorifera]|uniref:fimbrial biogenesis chaperone n=1 Tax=Serratia odorifera TaxID=618 RepID=UPI003D2E6FA2